MSSLPSKSLTLFGKTISTKIIVASVAGIVAVIAGSGLAYNYFKDDEIVEDPISEEETEEKKEKEEDDEDEKQESENDGEEAVQEEIHIEDSEVTNEEETNQVNLFSYSSANYSFSFLYDSDLLGTASVSVDTTQCGNISKPAEVITFSKSDFVIMVNNECGIGFGGGVVVENYAKQAVSGQSFNITLTDDPQIMTSYIANGSEIVIHSALFGMNYTFTQNQLKEAMNTIVTTMNTDL